MQQPLVKFGSVLAVLAGTLYLAYTQGARTVTRPKSIDPAIVRSALNPPPPAPAPSGGISFTVRERPEYAGSDVSGRQCEYCTVVAPIDALGDYIHLTVTPDSGALATGLAAARDNRFKPKELAFLGEMNKLGKAGWEAYGTMVYTPIAMQQPQAEVGPHVAILLRRQVKPAG